MASVPFLGPEARELRQRRAVVEVVLVLVAETLLKVETQKELVAYPKLVEAKVMKLQGVVLH